MKLQSLSARLNNASATRLLRTGLLTTIRGLLSASVVPHEVLRGRSDIDKDPQRQIAKAMIQECYS